MREKSKGAATPAFFLDARAALSSAISRFMASLARCSPFSHLFPLTKNLAPKSIATSLHALAQPSQINPIRLGFKHAKSCGEII